MGAANTRFPHGIRRIAEKMANAAQRYLRELGTLFILTKYYPGPLPEVKDLFASQPKGYGGN
jgi:hypothetical protein